MREPKQAWIAELGEYEQRYTAFVGTSIESLLALVRKTHPEGDYVYEKEVHQEVIKDGKVYVKAYVNHFLRGKVYINPSGGNFELSQHDYDLSEVDFAG